MMERHKSNHFAKVIASDLHLYEKIEAAPFAFAVVPYCCEGRVGEAMKALCFSEGHKASRFNSWQKPFADGYREKVCDEILVAIRQGDKTEEEVVKAVRRNRNMVHKYMMEMMGEGLLTRYRPARVRVTTPYKWRIASREGQI